jgi:hypothetical protein
MKTPKLLLWSVMVGVLAGLGGSASLLFAQEKAAGTTDAMMNAWRGRASPPSRTSEIDVETRAVGTSGTRETTGTSGYRMNAWRGHASPPSPAGLIDVETGAAGTFGTKESTKTPTYVVSAWRGRVSPPSPAG